MIVLKEGKLVPTHFTVVIPQETSLLNWRQRYGKMNLMPSEGNHRIFAMTVVREKRIKYQVRIFFPVNVAKYSTTW